MHVPVSTVSVIHRYHGYWDASEKDRGALNKSLFYLVAGKRCCCSLTFKKTSLVSMVSGIHGGVQNITPADTCTYFETWTPAYTKSIKNRLQYAPLLELSFMVRQGQTIHEGDCVASVS